MMRRCIFILFSVFFGALLSSTVHAQTASLDAILRDYVDADDPAVAIEVTAPDGHWAAARGRVDIRAATPATPQDRFRIGSMSKTFVATVALQLVSEGVFSLDDRAANWLPRDVVRRVANGDRVTLRQLLGMRSGIPDYLSTNRFWNRVDEDIHHEWVASEALPFIFDRTPLFQPGRRFYYSNTNYILMQLILEAVTGQPLHVLVRQRILDPLGLHDTYSQGVETLPGGFVRGYEDYDGDRQLEDVTDINDGWGLGDGALISSTGDLTTFYRALLQDQTLLDSAEMDELLHFRNDNSPGSYYSLGLGKWDTDWGTLIGHDGAVLGFLSTGAYFPDSGVIVIALSASANVDPWEIAQDALDEVIG